MKERRTPKKMVPYDVATMTSGTLNNSVVNMHWKPKGDGPTEESGGVRVPTHPRPPRLPGGGIALDCPEYAGVG